MPCRFFLRHNDKRSTFLRHRMRRYHHRVYLGLLLQIRTANGKLKALFSSGWARSLHRMDRGLPRFRRRHHYHQLLVQREASASVNGVAWINPNLRTGTKLSTIWRRRSKRGTIHEKRSKRMRIGAASSSATCKTSFLMNCRQRMLRPISLILR